MVREGSEPFSHEAFCGPAPTRSQMNSILNSSAWEQQYVFLSPTWCLSQLPSSYTLLGSRLPPSKLLYSQKGTQTCSKTLDFATVQNYIFKNVRMKEQALLHLPVSCVLITEMELQGHALLPWWWDLVKPKVPAASSSRDLSAACKRHGNPSSCFPPTSLQRRSMVRSEKPQMFFLFLKDSSSFQRPRSITAGNGWNLIQFSG